MHFARQGHQNITCQLKCISFTWPKRRLNRLMIFRPAFFSNKKVCPSDMYHLCICLLCFFNSIHFYECMHPQGHCLLYLFLFLPWLMEHTQNVGGNIIYNPWICSYCQHAGYPEEWYSTKPLGKSELCTASLSCFWIAPIWPHVFYQSATAWHCSLFDDLNIETLMSKSGGGNSFSPPNKWKCSSTTFTTSSNKKKTTNNTVTLPP